MKNYNNFILNFVIVFLFIKSTIGPPPPRIPQENSVADHGSDGKTENEANQNRLYDFPYSQYLELIVKILEEQPKFREKIQGMNEDEIKAGNIADHLDDILDGEVFDKLTKAKADEIERLRKEVQEQMEKNTDLANIHMPEHIDLDQWEKFTKEDLRKLIKKTVADMEKLDAERRENYKKDKMKEKAEQDHELAQINSDEREKMIKEIDEARKKHVEHEKLKHPGARDQLEEVWEERDHMDKESYNPRAFFSLHDLNGDGYWNQEEIEALFQIELAKIPNDDPKEKIEEMHRMREHMVKQMDVNGDHLISLEEFLRDGEAQNEKVEDPGWNDLANQKIYTSDELATFEKEYAAQKGWGEHPYDQQHHTTTFSTPSLNHNTDQKRYIDDRNQIMPEDFNINVANVNPPLSVQKQPEVVQPHLPSTYNINSNVNSGVETPHHQKPVDQMYGV